MKLSKYIFSTLLFTNIILAESLFFDDADFDGVTDTYDLCPNTPMLALVDKDGCSNELQYFFIVGTSFINDTNTNSNSTYKAKKLHLDFGMKKSSWTYRLSSSYLDSTYKDDTQKVSTDGLSDLELSVLKAYDINMQTSFSIEGYLKIPSAKESISTGKYDYGIYLNLDYYKNSILYFSTLGYIINGNSDNSFSKLLGISYNLTSKVYSSLSYKHENSLLDNESHINYINPAFGFFINDKHSININYNYGKSDIATYQTLLVNTVYNF